MKTFSATARRNIRTASGNARPVDVNDSAFDDKKTSTSLVVPSSLNEATWQRLGYAFPDVCAYLEELEADSAAQQQRLEAKSTELLRSINVGQELIEQLDAVKSHCTLVARERDALQLRNGQLQRDIEILTSSQAVANGKASNNAKKEHATVTEIAQQVKKAREEHLQEVDKLQRRIEELRSAKDADNQSKLSLEKQLFESNLHLTNANEKIVELQAKLKEAARREQRIAKEMDMAEVQRQREAQHTTFLSVSDVRAVSVLMTQLRDMLEELAQIPPNDSGDEGSNHNDRLDNTEALRRLTTKTAASPARGLASSRFTPYRENQGHPTDASSVLSSAFLVDLYHRKQRHGPAAAAGVTGLKQRQPVPAPDGFMPTPHDDKAARHARSRSTGDDSDSSDSNGGGGEEKEAEARLPDSDSTDADVQPMWLHRRPPTSSLATMSASPERHDVLRWMMDVLESAKGLCGKVRMRVDQMGLASQALDVKLTSAQEALATSERRCASLEEQVKDSERRLGSAKEAQERFAKQFEGEKAHLEKQLAETAARAAAQVREAQREIQDVKQQAAAQHDAFVGEVSLQFNRLQAAHSRVEGELAQREEAAAAADARHEGELRSLQQRTEQLQHNATLLEEEKDAALKELQRHHDSLEQLRRTAEERLKSQDAAAQSHLRLSVAAHETAANAAHETAANAARKECESLKSQLDALHRQSQGELDAMQSAKLTALKENQRLKEAIAALKREVLPEARQRVAHVERLLAQRTEELKAAKASLETMRAQEGEARAACSQLEERLTTATEKNGDLQRLSDGQQQAVETERAAAAAARRELTEALDQAAAAQEERDSLRSALAVLRAQTQTLQRQVSERGTSDATARQALELRLAEVKQLLAQSEASAEEGVQRATAAEEKNVLLTESLRASQAAATAAESRANTVASDAALAESTLRQRIAQMEQACARLQSAAAAQDQARESLQSELTALRSAHAEAEARASRLEGEVAAVKADAAEAQRQQLGRLKDACDAVTRDHEAALSHKEQELADTRKLVARMESALQDREAELQEATSQVTRLSTELADAKHMAPRYAKDNEALRAALDRARDELRELQEAATNRARRQREGAEQESQTLVQRLKELKAAREADEVRHQAELQTLQLSMEKRIEQATRDASAAIQRSATQEKASLESQLRQLRDAHETAARKLKGELKLVEGDRDRLQSALTALRVDVKAMHSALEEKEQQSRMQSAQEMSAHEERLRRQHRSELSAKVAQVESLSTRVMELQATCEKLQSELEQHTERVRDMTMQLQLEERSKEAQRRELEALRKINTNLEARLEEIQHERDPLRQQLHSLLSAD